MNQARVINLLHYPRIKKRVSFLQKAPNKKVLKVKAISIVHTKIHSLKHLVLRSLKSAIFFYMLKCLVSLSVGYILYVSFPNHLFYWTLISILIVTAPDPKDSVKFAFDRMKANIIGSITGLLLFVINGPVLLLMATGVVMTIAICSQLKLITVSRTALAAMLIVMIREKNGNDWKIALERMGCVIMGCVIVLVVTIFFNYIAKRHQGIKVIR
jgi:uncharacterized membrane protein YccC